MPAGHPHNCDCCAGVGATTPARIDNAPGASQIEYRAGTHALFKQSLLARLSDSQLRALSGLTTRDDDDFSIALCDCLAATLDVLTFYQERIANENYLRTATERRSILELARLIGYELGPGVAASTTLAFFLQQAPGSPHLAPAPVQIPAGTRVQSVPGSDEKPQAFETTEEIQARPEWSAMGVHRSVDWEPKLDDMQLWLQGVDNSVSVGDTILIVGQERLDYRIGERWDVRVLTEVTPDRGNERTRIRWDEPLGSRDPEVHPARSGASVYVFRQRASLFGHNAPDPRLLSLEDNKLSILTDGVTWNNFQISGDQIDLDGDFPKIVPGSWVAIKGPPTARFPRGYVELYRANSVEHLSRTAFGISSKITRVVGDTTENLTTFQLRSSTVLAQSELLPVASQPLDYPLYGSVLTLDRPEPDLHQSRLIAVSGRRPRIRLRKGAKKQQLELPGRTRELLEGNSLILLSAPELKGVGEWTVLRPDELASVLADPDKQILRMSLLDPGGAIGSLTCPASTIELEEPAEEDEEVSELAEIGGLPGDVEHGSTSSTFRLAAPLKNCYARSGAKVNANVARASHGETVDELLGNGDGTRPNQAFRLSRSPLTFVKAPTPSGRRSTLEVRVNDLAWEETDSLFHAAARDRAYETKIDSQSRASIHFGDGVNGTRPPSGDHNVRVTYRHGLGVSGNVDAGSITNLLSRPLGVTGASNPEPAVGGEDPEPQELARHNLVLTVKTLQRAVSVSDYRDFARSFAGIAKAHALWVDSGPGRGMFITVAAEFGNPIAEGGDTHSNLEAALREYGDPLIPIRISSYTDARFKLRLSVVVAGNADPSLVLADLEQQLRQRFGFSAREFGQGISVDAVTAVAQEVKGVTAVNVLALHRADADPQLRPRIAAALPAAGPTSRPEPAELLRIDDGPIDLDMLT